MTLCPHFGRCGGCLYQDLPHAAYIQKKRLFILRSFADKGINLTLDEFIETPLHTRRRAGFKFSSGRFGFYEHQGHGLIDLTECRLLTPRLEALLPAFRKVTRQVGGKGELFVLDTALGVDMRFVVSGRAADLAILEILSAFAGHQDDIVRIWWNHTPVLEKAPLPVPTADSFLQPSVFGEETLIRLVSEQAAGCRTAVDLFCGAGTFLIPLLAQGIKATGYDIAGESLKRLGTHAVARDLFRAPLTTDELDKTDLVVLDPPRQGAAAQAAALADSTVGRIVMVSCNPVTAARDTRLLTEKGWEIGRAVALDQFTYSNHIEIILTFLKKNATKVLK